MTNEEAINTLNSLKDYYNDKNEDSYVGFDNEDNEALDLAINALETTCIEDYPTCTECEHYDSEKHYCPRFCQVIKDTLAEAQPSEDCTVIKKLSKKYYVEDAYGYTDEDIVNKVNEIIDAVNESSSTPQIEPCEDTVSRSEAIDKLTKLYNMVLDDINIRDIVGTLERLPSVTPQASEEDIHREREQAYMLGYEDASKKFRTEPNEDCISRKQALDDKGLAVFHRYDDYVKMRNYLKALPSVTLQRQKGKWIIVDDCEQFTAKCSVCGNIEDSRLVNRINLCPNCGAKMGGGEDEEML